MKRYITALLTVTMIILLAGCGEPKVDNSKIMYVASAELTAPVYAEGEDLSLTEVSSMVRGTQVTATGDVISITEEDVPDYFRILYDSGIEDDKTNYYMAAENLSESPDRCALETTFYNRSDITLLKEPDDAAISGFVKKGNQLTVTGYDTLNEKGEVNMYQVQCGDVSGWTFSRYLAETIEEANDVNPDYYNANADKVYSMDLYGGAPTDVDYLVYPKGELSKELPLDVRAYYVVGTAIDNIDAYIELAKEAGSNALVLDIKDKSLTYPVSVAETMCPTGYASTFTTFESFKNAVQKAKDAGLWTIGRLVCFNDPQYAADHPDTCILDNGVNTGWPSAYNRSAWEYNAKLAVQVIKDTGIDEIQLDYVRFPDNSYALSAYGGGDYGNTYGESKVQAVQNFCRYISDQIHKAGAYVSVDVFGECSNGYVTAYGQYWPAISNVVDVISSMPYVDHFGRGEDTWSNPSNTVYNWATYAAEAQAITPNPAVPRTWLSCYEVPYWDPFIYPDGEFLGGQVQSLWDAGLGYGGFMAWNEYSDLNIYRNVAPAFSRQYQ